LFVVSDKLLLLQTPTIYIIESAGSKTCVWKETVHCNSRSMFRKWIIWLNKFRK